jgi:hypothetical protein
MLRDHTGANKYRTESEWLLAAIRGRFLDSGTSAYGTTWQLNALAYLAFGDDSKTGPDLWSHIFSQVKQDTPSDQVISPYFNVYVLDAMAAMGHSREALEWIRAYWGGMLAEGATSFWESYDLRWPKTNPHLSLQADGTSGYFVSLAHGWSSGPTAWLSENVLGIREPKDGYKEVVIAPRLAGLDWARGTVPTPGGVISIRVDKEKGVILDLPARIEKAFVSLPVAQAGTSLYLNGVRVAGGSVTLTHAGHYELAVR